MTINQLIDELSRSGGAIVSSAACSPMEIAYAHGVPPCDGLCGLGFVLRSQEWLDLQKARELAHPNTDGKYISKT